MTEALRVLVVGAFAAPSATEVLLAGGFAAAGHEVHIVPLDFFHDNEVTFAPVLPARNRLELKGPTTNLDLVVVVHFPIDVAVPDRTALAYLEPDPLIRPASFALWNLASHHSFDAFINFHGPHMPEARYFRATPGFDAELHGRTEWTPGARGLFVGRRDVEREWLMQARDLLLLRGPEWPDGGAIWGSELRQSMAAAGFAVNLTPHDAFAPPFRFWECLGFGLPLLSDRAPLGFVAGRDFIGIAPGDVDGLRLAVQRLRDDERYARGIAAAGHAAVKPFTWTRTATEIAAWSLQAATITARPRHSGPRGTHTEVRGAALKGTPVGWECDA